jgi:hypothetical protein
MEKIARVEGPKRHLVDTWQKVEYIDETHVPCNKRPHEVEHSKATAQFSAHDSGNGFSLSVEEVTQVNASGPVQTRTISLHLDRGHALEVLRFLCGRLCGTNGNDVLPPNCD